MNDSDSYSFTTPEVDTIRLIMRIICPLAILSNCGVLYCVAFIKSKQTHLGVLQVYLSIADIVVSISLILGTSILDREALCTVVGVLTNYFLNASSCFSFLVAVYAYLTVLYDMCLAERYWWAYNLYGWCMPFASTVVMFAVQGLARKGNVIGDSLYFCWISPEYPRLRFVLYYPLLWLHFLGLIFVYTRIFIAIEASTKDLSDVGTSSTVPIPPLPTTTLSSLAIHHSGASINDSPPSSRASVHSQAAPSSSNTLKLQPNRKPSSASSLKSYVMENTVPPLPTFHRSLPDLANQTGIHEPPSNSYPIPPLPRATSSTSLRTSVKSNFYNPLQFTSTSRKNSHHHPIQSRPSSINHEAAARKMKQSRDKLLLKTLIIAFGFVASWVPATVKHYMSVSGDVPGWLTVLAGVGLSVQGFWNSGSFFAGLVWDWEHSRK